MPYLQPALFLLSLFGTLVLAVGCPGDGPGEPEPIDVEVGTSCEADADCDGELTCRDDFPGGACVSGCDDGCPTGSTCTVVQGDPVCLASCDNDSACRNGYGCTEGACQPADSGGGPDGGGIADTDAGNVTEDGGERDSTDAADRDATAPDGDDREMDDASEVDGGSTDCDQGLEGTLSTRTLQGECTYTVQDTLVIPGDATVTVEAGATLEFDGLYSVDIGGRLDVRGSSDAPVRMVGARASPGPGDWGNILVGEAGSLRLDGAIVRHFSGIGAFGGSVQITDSELAQVRPSNQSTYDVDIEAVAHLHQASTGELRKSRVVDVTGPDGLGVLTFDADGIDIVDTRFENVDKTAVSINGFDSSPGGDVHHNRFVDSGGLAFSEVVGVVFEYNDLTDNEGGIWVTREDFTSTDHSMTHNNFAGEGDYEISAEGRVNVDASNSYWGDAAPSDRVETDQSADVDTSDARDAPVEEAGPR